MTHSLGYLFCLLGTLVVILGDWCIKVAADRGGTLASPHFIAGCVLYALSALFWYLAMQRITLGQIGVAFSVFTLLALVSMGVALFGESFGLRDALGVGLAIAALLLMARFV
jgi:undecaprenyl phosphate-alpha-L-ara4N flippase subunit ArnF